MSDKEVDKAFRERRYDDAATRLKVGWEKQGENGRDSLLYILDLGLALHSAGKWDESTKYLLRAGDLAVIKDYTSLSKEAATLLTSDNIKDYKAEDFENVLINTYLAMNYALQGNFEDALVEARRTNQKLYMMVSEGKRKYKQNAFTKYLSAILYESDGDFGNAYVDYKAVRDLVPDFPGLGKDLWRSARLERIKEDLEQWDEEYKLTDQDHQDAMSVGPTAKKGEIIILYENGISPIKEPDPQFRELPKFYPRPNPVSYADIEVNGQVVAQTHVLHNIEETAIENLDEKWGALLAKKLAGIVAKEAVGYEVGKMANNKAVGDLVKIGFYLSDQADVRSWELLPHDLQMVRIALDSGNYHLRILPHGGAAGPVQEVSVQAGKRTFVNYRFMP